MRKLMMKMSISLDGFVCGPHGETDWIFRSSDASSRKWVVEKTQEAGLILMGRKSFENMATYWPTATGPFAAPMNDIPKAVFTQNGFKGISPVPDLMRLPTAASWLAAQVCKGDLVEEISNLKSRPGKPILAIGGAGFMRSLIATGLIDEYHLVMHPVVLGEGLAIFNGLSSPLDLKLFQEMAFPEGVVVHSYSV